jgi:hypothetical protein
MLFGLDYRDHFGVRLALDWVRKSQPRIDSRQTPRRLDVFRWKMTRYASVTDNFHEPGTPILATEAWEKSEGAQAGFLVHILRVFRVSCEPAG